MEKRICSGKYGCGQEKLLISENFYLIKKTGKFSITCKECLKKQNKINHIKNKIRDNKNCERNHIDNKERDNKKSNQYYNSDIGKNSYYKSVGYKINGRDFTVQDYNELWIKQKGSCVICEVDLKGKDCIDHDHQTGEVRSLLCTKCNIGVGWYEIFKDKASKYLK